MSLTVELSFGPLHATGTLKTASSGMHVHVGYQIRVCTRASIDDTANERGRKGRSDPRTYSGKI